MSQGFCGDPFWDQSISWETMEPDFTECFKQTILVWIPCGFLLIFSLLDIYRRSQSRYSDIPWSILNISKYLVLGSLFVLTIIDMAMIIISRSKYDIKIYDGQIVSVIVKAATFIVVALLQLLHKKTGEMSSGLLFIFWLLLVVFAIPQLLSEVTQDKNLNSWTEFQYVNYILYFTLICIMLVLNIFPDKQPKNTTFKKTTRPSPEKTSSFLRQIFFQWFDRTAWIGWRRPLTEKDIFDINPENTSAELVPPFDKYFNESVERNRKRQLKKQGNQKDSSSQHLRTTEGSILPAMVKAYGGPFTFAALLQLVMNALTFASPLILNELITFTGKASSGTAPFWQGIFLTLVLFVVSFLLAIVNAQYYFRCFLVGFRIRTGLISAIYKKALRISSAAKKDITVGEIVNLMAVDAQRFFDLIQYMHILWSGPLVIAIAIWLLWLQLGVSVIAGLVVMILMIPITGYVADQMRKLQFAQMEYKDDRVKSMNEILNGMKVLKLYAWEPSFEKLILGYRSKEISVLRKAAMFNAVTYFVWSVAPFLVSLASYITFVLLGNELTPNIAFVSIALFNVLQFPMTMFPMMVSFTMQAWVSVQRISKFLNAEEIQPNNVTNKPSEDALKITDGTFTWGGETTTLKNINMNVKKGNLTAIVGSVGCGKTSMLSALLGEMEKIKGSVNVDGRIAYVSQQAWIQNATLKDNILFGRPLDKKRYDTVIQACALTQDLAMLPGGDQTEIGEKGINLSGGQKQRISLARAVYSGADVYLFDDPLSAVDSHVGKHIFDNVFSEDGLLAEKTRLLVTHAVVYLPRVFEIYVMVNGEITESGSYKELLSQKGAFSEFLEQHIQELDDDDEELLELQNVIEDQEVKLILERSLVRRSSAFGDKASLNGSASQKRGSRRSSDRSDRGEKAEKPLAKTKLIDDEDAATGGVGNAVYLRYIRSIGFVLAFLAISCNGIQQAANVFSSIWLTRWSTDLRANDPDDHTMRNIYMGVHAALGGAQGISLFATSIIFGLGCLRAARDLHNKMLHNTMRLPMSFFDTTPLGRILNRFSKDIDIIDNLLPMSVRFWTHVMWNAIAIIVVISYSTPIFLSVVAPMAVIYYFIQTFYVATLRQLKRMEAITRSPIYTHFSETITGQSTIRAYGEEERFKRESETRVDYNQKMNYPSIIANRWLQVRLEIIGALVVLFAALFAVLADGISPATVGLSIAYALQISQILGFLVTQTAEIEANIICIERVNEYSNVKQEAPWKTVEMDPEWPQQGVVEFKNFQVRYREGLDLVLKGIDFSVKSQEKIGIVGRTGAGKSSLTLALFRIIEAADGKIIIDNVDISQIGLHSLRSRLTIIPQDPVLFSGSLRMNIDPFNHYSDDQIWMALENAHLKAFVKGLIEGLDYKIAEAGENLSVGQRQLVCLARALLRKTKVLILDEATAAIDLDTDELIQNTIRTKFTDCTILTIAHRLNTIMDSDRVIVLDAGQIAEFDSPQVLLANTSSIFYGMANSAGLVNNNRDQIIEEGLKENSRLDGDDENTRI